MPSLVSTITNFLFPPLCVHCQREGAWLCPVARDILSRQPLLIDPLMIRGVDRVIVRGSYDCFPLQQLITKTKYHFWFSVRDSFSDLVKPILPELRSGPDTIIVPVPLHTRRHRERGFNQSALVAQALSKTTGLPVQPVLRRIRYTPPQAQLSAARRKRNVIDAFVVDSRVAQIPKSVILVDDVITTGSTIAECASILRQNGVQNITAVALAKG